MDKSYDNVPWDYVEGRIENNPLQTRMVANRITVNSGGDASIIASYCLWFFLGWAGIHHLYMGRGIGVWLVSLITFQGLGIWWFIDFFLIPFSSRKIRGQTTIIL